MQIIARHPLEMWFNQIAFKMQSEEEPSVAKKSEMQISGWEMKARTAEKMNYFINA